MIGYWIFFFPGNLSEKKTVNVSTAEVVVVPKPGERETLFSKVA